MSRVDFKRWPSYIQCSSFFDPLDPTDFDSICGISPGFPGIPSIFPPTVSKYPNLKCHLNITIYHCGMISSVFERKFQWL